MLLNSGFAFDLRAIDRNGERPLHVAAFVAGNGTNVVLAEALEYTLTLTPDVNVTDRAGMTALHLVPFGGTKPELEAMLRVLRDHCARTDLASESGQTADQIAEQGLTEVRTVYESVFTGPQANPSC